MSVAASPSAGGGVPTEPEGHHTPPDALPDEPPPRPPLWARVKRRLAGFPGPIFQKDIWISGRKSGTYWLRLLYALALLLVVGLNFVDSAHDLSNSQSRALALQALQRVAPQATQVILWFELIALALAGIIFGAPSVCEEKRAGTLATLLTTPLTAWQIVIGKTTAVFVQLLILTLVAAPLLLAVRVFGGVSAEVVIAGTALALSTALFAGLCGVYNSIGVKHTPRAIMGGFLMTVILQGIVPLGAGLFFAASEYYKWHIAVPAWVFISFSTPPALATALFGPPNGPGSVPSFFLSIAPWMTATAYTLVLSGLVAMASARRLRGVLAREGAGGSAIPKAKKVKKKAAEVVSGVAPSTGAPGMDTATAAPEAAAPGLPALPRSRRRASSVREGHVREVGDRPVLWREMRQEAFRPRWMMYVILGIIVVALGSLYYWVGLDEYAEHMTIGVICTIVLLLGSAVSGASAISGERESRTWEALLTTPLSAWDIIVGKTAGAVRRQWLIPAVLLAHFVIAVVVTVAAAARGASGDYVSPSVFVWLVLILGPSIAFLASMSTFMSLVCRKSAGATAATLGVALLLWAIGPLLIVWLASALGIHRADAEVGSLLMCINPVALMAVAMEGACRAHRGYQLFDLGRIGGDAFLLVCLAYAALFLAAAWGTLLLARNILRERTLRAR